MDNSAINKWLDDLALYFEHRDTHGEDKAFWANVANADSARNIKAALAAAEAREAEKDARIRGLEEALKPLANARCTGPGAFNRADLSDADFERARGALSQEKK